MLSLWDEQALHLAPDFVTWIVDSPFRTLRIFLDAPFSVQR